jgi:Flp pilus assembly pilin Flp
VSDDTTTSRGPALVAVAVLVAIIALVVITLSYSTVNTPFSVQGDQTEYSHNLDSGK